MNYDTNKHQFTKTIIYSNCNIMKDQELMIFAIYNKFYNNSLYFVEPILINKYDEFLKNELRKYSLKVNKLNNNLDSKDFIMGFLIFLEESQEKDYIENLSALINYYKDNISSIEESLKWVNNINKKNISFDTKTEVVLAINEQIFNINYMLDDLVSYETKEEIMDNISTAITIFATGIDYEDFSLTLFKEKLNEISKELLIMQIEDNKIDPSKSSDVTLRKLYSSFNENERKIFMHILPYVILNKSILQEKDEITSKLEKELGTSKIKIRMIMFKFILKVVNQGKKIEQMKNKEEKERIKQILLQDEELKSLYTEYTEEANKKIKSRNNEKRK